jgi:hypothetical protein
MEPVPIAKVRTALLLQQVLSFNGTQCTLRWHAAWHAFDDCIEQAADSAAVTHSIVASQGGQLL